MAPSTETITPNQLKRARTALWHQDGDALRTLDDARTWLDAAGLVPFYPHPQFAAAPQPSFAEAVLGRPEVGWIPPVADSPTAEAADRDGNDDDGDEEEFDEDSDDEDGDEDFGDEDAEEEDADEEEGDEEDADDEDAEQELSPEAADAEIMLSDDDEVAEDEGDEIAEMDSIHAAGEPAPNDSREASAEAVEAVPAVKPISGFSPDEKETVRRTLARMVAEGSAVPLNLLGSTTGEPDFICSSQAFSFVYTLRGDKTWKQEPAQTGSMRVSPLAVKVYEVLKEKGPMAPHELATEVAQGVVDTAILRGLSELWAIQRVIPVPDPDGTPAKWELMSGRFVRHLKAGANAGQPTALSALLSLYLSQAVAASSDEMETFLSPLAARSRVREVVGGLAASRQLDSVVLEGKTLMFMPGALDTLPKDIPAEETNSSRPRSRYEDDDRRAMIDARAAEFGAPGASEGAAEGRSRYPVRKPAGARPEGERGGRPGGARPSGGFGGPRREGGFAPQRRSGGFSAGGRDDRERRPFVRRDEGTPARPTNEFARPWEQDGGGERKPFTPREGGASRPFTPRSDSRSFGDRKPFVPRDGGERRPFAPRGDRPFTPRGDRPFTPREGSERRPFTPREGGGERRPFAPRGDRPFTPRGDGERRPFTPREGGDRPYTPRPFTSREGGDRKPFAPRGDRPFTPRGDGERRPFTPRGDRPFTPRGDGERRPFTPREGGDRPFAPRPFTPRDGGDRKPFAPRGDRPFTPRGDGERRPFTPREGGGERRPFAPRGDRPFTPRGDGERRPFTPRDGGDRKPFAPRGDRPFTPRVDGERRPFTPREGGGDRKPFAPRGDRPFTPRGDGERRPFTPREGGDRKPFAPRKSFGGGPGGFSKPGFSPARRGPGSGPGRGGAPKRRSE